MARMVPMPPCPTQKAKNAKGTFRRLLTFIKPEIPKIVLVLVCAIIATVFDIFAPRQLGLATTEIFRPASRLPMASQVRA